MNNQSKGNPYANSQEELFDRFVELSNRLLSLPLRQAGRAEVLDWDIEYVSGPAVVANVQYQVLRRINDFIADNSQPRILDIGSNIGLSVLHYKRLYPNAKITAFEPDPQFLPVLKRNLERNGAADVQAVEAAAWIEDGQAQWISEGIDGSKLIENNGDGVNVINVVTVDLKNYLDSPVDMIKLDIEGAEFQVIPHIAGDLDQVKNLSIECHINQGSYQDYGYLITLLANAGFSLSTNSYGHWEDLLREQKVIPFHFHQYIALSAWRDRPTSDLPYWGIVPNADLSLILDARELRKKISILNLQIEQLERTHQKVMQQLEELKDRLMESESQVKELEQNYQVSQTQYEELQNQYQASQALVQYLQQPLYRRAYRKVKRTLLGQ